MTNDAQHQGKSESDRQQSQATPKSGSKDDQRIRDEARKPSEGGAPTDPADEKFLRDSK